MEVEWVGPMFLLSPIVVVYIARFHTGGIDFTGEIYVLSFPHSTSYDLIQSEDIIYQYSL